MDFPHIKKAIYKEKYLIWIEFDDGLKGIVDLKDIFRGPVFEKLKDLQFFSQVFIDSELQTIAWPNGADLAPEMLRGRLLKGLL